MGRDVARVERRTTEEEGRGVRRLADVARCPDRDLLRCELGSGDSFECLVFAEVGDGHSERVDRDQFVWALGSEKEDKVRGVQIALQFAMVGGRVIDM